MAERLPSCGMKDRRGATEGLNWQEGADDGKMMNKYAAEEYCNIVAMCSLLPQSQLSCSSLKVSILTSRSLSGLYNVS